MTKLTAFIAALSLFLWSNSFASQRVDHTIEGTVYDAESKFPLAGAIISLVGEESNRVATDQQGKFVLPIGAADKGEIRITYVGFKPVQTTVKSGEKAVINLETDEKSLGAVEIRGDRIRTEGTKSLSIESIDRELISRNQTASLGTLLGNIQGVTFASFGSNIQLPIIHGLYGNRILILNNGFKHGFQNWGSDHAPEIDIQSAESISVIKGAAAVRFGPDALGGAVVTESHSMPFNSELNGSAVAGFQSNGRGFNTGINLSEGYGNFSWHLGGNVNIVGDRHTPDYMLTNTGAREYSAFGGAKFKISDNLIAKANYSFMRQNLGILRASIGSSGAALIRNFEAERPVIIRDFSYDINEPNQFVSHHLASLKLDWSIDPDNHVSFRYAFQSNGRQEFDVRRNAELPIIDLNLTTQDIQADYSHKLSDRIHGIVGGQILMQSNANNPGTGITPFIPNYEGFRASMFLVETLQRGNSEWELGIRYDYERNSVAGRERTQASFSDSFSFSNFTAALGFVHEINEKTTFRSNVGTGWRPPNMAELYSFGQHEARQLFGLLRYYEDAEGNLQNDRVVSMSESGVEAEQSYKWVNEIEINGSKGRFSASFYANYIANFIFWRPIGVVGTLRGPMPTYIFDQANAFFTGLDLTYEWEHSPNWSSKIGGSYIWSQNVERNEPLINQPPININYQLAFDKRNVGPFDRLELALQPMYTFRQFQAPREVTIRDIIEGNVTIDLDSEIFDFLAPPPGYFLLNGFAKAEKGDFGLSLQVHNALNTRYRDYLNAMRFFADDLGRNIMLTIHYKF
ncbi:TonB-dependent receptor [Mongoliitalea daihaiensis]|uniref:TonB-dependent receptor n=1 Tax=Mongoliitalea daihaiensis TaxID=2782006 RepID=UPI001F2260FD|nr:TonB-dependent receptor [Mongoliitalea daihaiensis]UJP66149.1 TonB-dependent receptor [Mongoliitalea daihaiensis]